MGFNRKKMELERKTEAEKQARARRALDTQILEDALRLVAAWNERQAGRMPMLFSPTIGAAITARHWYSMGALPRLPDHDGNRLTQYRSSPRRGDYQPHSLAVVPVMPTARAVRRIGAIVSDQHCRRVIQLQLALSPYGHLIPSAPIESAPLRLFVNAAPLFKMERDALCDARVPNIPYPCRVHRSCLRTTLTTGDYPINTIKLH